MGFVDRKTSIVGKAIYACGRIFARIQFLRDGVFSLFFSLSLYLSTVKKKNAFVLSPQNEREIFPNECFHTAHSLYILRKKLLHPSQRRTVHRYFFSHCIVLFTSDGGVNDCFLFLIYEPRIQRPSVVNQEIAELQVRTGITVAIKHSRRDARHLQ